MLAAVSAFRITQLLLVPPIVVAMAKHPAVRNGNWDLSSVRTVVCGAAPLGKEVVKEFESLWKDKVVNIKQGWGMTEYVSFASTKFEYCEALNFGQTALETNICSTSRRAWL